MKKRAVFSIIAAGAMVASLAACSSGAGDSGSGDGGGGLIGVEAWEDFAEIARTELLVIDQNTTKRGFAHEVKWNSAYYRLAQSI